MVKASLGIILDIWTKTRWLPFTIFLQNTKSANISKTIRDRAISSEFLTHRVVQEYLVSNFTTFGGHLEFLWKMKNCKYL